jgi:UDP-glucose 4-epimerase
MASVWITGATGFMGRHLARYLHGRGHIVCGVGHGTWPEAEASAGGVSRWINGEVDATNLELLKRFGGPPELVFHLAGGSSVGASLAMPLEDFSRTVATTARLMDWLRTAAPGAHIVAASSAAVYGASHQGRIHEDASCRPYSPYGRHKAMMESLLQSYSDSYGMRCSVVRLFSVYGPGLRKQLLWDVCSRLRAGAPALELGGTGGELRDWVEVSDVVRLLALIGARPSQGFSMWNGGSGQAEPVSAIAAFATEAWGRDVRTEFSGEARPGDPFSLVADPTNLQGLEFDWTIKPREGIARYVAWFKETQGQ